MVFADTSGLLAAWFDDETRHQEAAQAWRDLAKRGEKLLTTNLILAETVTIVRRRHGWKASRTAGDALLRSRNVELVTVTREQLDAAWRDFLRDPDPKLSLCDTCSFVVMRERGVDVALTLDRHFADAGFEVVPSIE